MQRDGEEVEQDSDREEREDLRGVSLGDPGEFRNQRQQAHDPGAEKDPRRARDQRRRGVRRGEDRGPAARQGRLRQGYHAERPRKANTTASGKASAAASPTEYAEGRARRAVRTAASGIDAARYGRSLPFLARIGCMVRLSIEGFVD